MAKTMTKAGPADVDAYIAAAPKAAQPMLRQVRRVIKAAAPKAVEKISYGMPFYEYHGRLVYFAGYQKHVGLYAALPAKNPHAKEVAKYMAAKSTVQLPIGQPLPVTLITKLVKLRVKENEARASR
ncbi:MAG: DUF1801 domain-containing protein [Candidatus Dormibacteraeota bacterium]|nr:DUF1801 domain-containing protein [Candidatus Dormibacteraeota bacterium]